MIKRPYPPGEKTKKRTSAFSEYSKELREKQKLKNWYNLSEEQFKKYVKEALKKRGTLEDAGTFLIKRLESRFDNIVFRLGLATSHNQARQMISHRSFLVNGKIINMPSCHLKKGDKITFRSSSAKLNLKKHELPSWLGLDLEKLTAEIKEEPMVDLSTLPAEISVIFEYYSR